MTLPLTRFAVMINDNYINTVRQLSEKYFNATISARESMVLTEYALDLTGENPSCILSDEKLLNDLRVIALIHGHSAATIGSMALAAPEDLGKRLEKHISSLARDSRRRRFKTWIISSAASAAAIAVVCSIGIHYQGSTDTVSGTGVQKQEILAKTGNFPDAEPQNEKNAASPNLIASASIPSASPKRMVKREKPAPSAARDQQEIQPAELIEPSVINLPEFQDPMLEIRPVIEAAAIDPAKIVIQPLSTLGQSVCNVYESVDAVATAFSNIAETLEIINSSLASATSYPVELN